MRMTAACVCICSCPRGISSMVGICGMVAEQWPLLKRWERENSPRNGGPSCLGCLTHQSFRYIPPSTVTVSVQDLADPNGKVWLRAGTFGKISNSSEMPGITGSVMICCIAWCFVSLSAAQSVLQMHVVIQRHRNQWDQLQTAQSPQDANGARPW